MLGMALSLLLMLDQKSASCRHFHLAEAGSKGALYRSYAFNPAKTKIMLTDAHKRKLHYRAHHRGTREADAIVGGFFDADEANWSAEDIGWFERLLDEQDVDIMGWAMGTISVPAVFDGPLMQRMRRLDYITLPSGLGPNG
jgi:antitoxin CptB